MPEPVVLILDDEEQVRTNLVTYLSDEGFELHEARNGEEGLACVRRAPIDVGVVDMRLPGMDGNTFILRAHEIRPTLRFIVHTGSMTYDVPERLRAIGVTPGEVLHKPISDLSRLVRAIRSLAHE
jgi:CheY-like chemotaxis protein